MKQRFLSVCLAALVLLYAAVPLALAQDDEIKHDAKLLNYPQNANLGDGSTALTWLLLIFLILIAIGVMKMDAKRSHLD
jgi:hypothetical protein